MSYPNTRLFDIYLPTEEHILCIDAYFDESGTDDGSRFVCVAGYLFSKNDAVSIDSEWCEMLRKYRLEYFHMVDCAHNTGVFEKLTRKECIEAEKEAISLIKKHAIHGIALSLDKNDYDLIPKNEYFINPYSFLTLQTFQGIKKWADEHDYWHEIACMYERGAHGFGSFWSVTNNLWDNPELRHQYRLKVAFPLVKTESVQLQCADILAWHWHTYNKRESEGKDPMRKDFKSLIALRNVDVHHYNSEAIAMWLESNGQA